MVVMHPVLLIFGVAWIAGVVAGTANLFWLVVIVSLVVVISGRRLLNLPYLELVAMVVVSLLGFVYGWSVVVDVPVCKPGVGDEVRVIRHPSERENATQYWVARGDGCTFVVYAPRWNGYEIGSVLQLTGGKWSSLDMITQDNVGYGKYLVRHGISGVLVWPDITVLTGPQRSGVVYRMVREQVQRIYPEPEASVVQAMLLADRGLLPDDVLKSFRVSGISHVLAISGLHVSLVAGLLVAAMWLVPFRRGARTILVLLLLWGYIWFIGAPISALRAGFLWSIGLVAFRLGLLMSLPTALGLTVLSLITIDPSIVFDVGFQLSVGAVGGIFIGLYLLRPCYRHVSEGKRFLLQAGSVTFSATLATWPLISYHFGLVSFISLLANLLVVPLVSAVVFLGIGSLIVSFVSLSGGVLMAYAVHGLLSWMILVANVLSVGQWSWVEYTISLRGLIIYYVVLIGLVVLVIWRQGRSGREIWI